MKEAGVGGGHLETPLVKDGVEEKVHIQLPEVEEDLAEEGFEEGDGLAKQAFVEAWLVVEPYAELAHVESFVERCYAELTTQLLDLQLKSREKLSGDCPGQDVPNMCPLQRH
ncbi:hypothetical protein MMC30_006033 [Trapelia coarctata]|nr:hypothetical protein [Trapelia coarctata]